jgi:hypothetical protein
MTTIDWDEFDLEPLCAEIRAGGGGPDAERTIWAFEQALQAARVDETLLEHLLTATVCLVARAQGCSPRTVLESFFRRSVPDETWRERFLPLLDG